MKYSVRFIAAVGILLVVLVAACSGVVERGSNKVTNAQIPPIDTLQPAEIETATFALG